MTHDGITSDEIEAWEKHIEERYLRARAEPVLVKWKKAESFLPTKLYLTLMWDGKVGFKLCCLGVRGLRLKTACFTQRNKWYSRISKPAKHDNLADMLYDLLMRSSHDMCATYQTDSI